MKKNKNSLLQLINLFLLVLILTSCVKLQSGVESEKELQQVNKKAESNIDESTYYLELEKWGIYNDGTHSEETTKGFNEALIWANRQGYNTFYVPAGTYLVSKGESETDPNARINLVSNMTFLMDDEVVIQKETNGYEIYSTLFLGSEVENVTIRGGTLRGDRETHDYTQKGDFTEGSHEWGNGINTNGARNVVIDSVKIEKFTGDGIEIGGSTIYGDYITETDLEQGGISEEGQPVAQEGKIRSNNYEVTNFNQSIYQNTHFRNLMMWIPEGVEGTYDLFYYRKDGSFIKEEKDQRFNSTWGYAEIPKDADYFRVVFNSSTTKKVKVNRMTVAITKNITIQNCDIGYNRRQGITVGASDGVKIVNNRIHHTQGTAPESGIDIEPGFYPAINTVIKGNKFTNNKIHMVFSYGGQATVEDNYFGPNEPDGLGFSINPAYYGALVRSNEFEKSSFDTWGNTKFINNKLISSSASFEGGTDVVVEGVEGIDSSIGFTQTKENGIEVKNIKLSSLDNKIKGGIYVYGKPIKLININIQDNNELGGEGNNESVYEKVTFTNTPEMNLPVGVYNECLSEGGEFSLNVPGTLDFNKCHFNNTFFYTYNEQTEAIFQNSTFEIKDFSNTTILAMEAKNVSVLRNTFNIESEVELKYAVIQIGRDASEKDPSKVAQTTISNNEIHSSKVGIGIDTTNGGIGNHPYTIEENILVNVNLNLRKIDTNRANKIVEERSK